MQAIFSTLSIYQIIILLIALSAILFAVYLFIKTPPKERMAILSNKPEKKPGIEYAPLYTTKEKVGIIIKNLLWIIPLFLFLEFWFLPTFKDFSINANCYNYSPINGLHLVFYGVFVIIPLLCAVIIFLSEGLDAIKAFKIAQYPLPNKKVLHLTPYKYGRAARLHVLFFFIPIACFVGLSIWGGYVAYDLTRYIKPCSVIEKTIQSNDQKHGKFSASKL